ncbi:MAG: hypothetical protein ACRDL6_06705 [Solirubrobacterales bacterium]
MSALIALPVLAIVALPRGASALPGPTDLALTKSDSADPVTKESNFTYTIQVANQGANDATDVLVTDTLPSQVEFASATASSGTCSRAGSVVTCNLGQVNAAVTAIVTIVVEAKGTGTASNTAVVTSPDDTNAANNQDTETTVITEPAKTAKGKGKKKKKKKKKIRASCGSPTISGTAGDDRIVGTSRGEVIVTFGGKDRVFAGGGKDLICTGAGTDLVSGGPKADTIIGGRGRDRLFGNTGRDLLKGKAGRDRLRGNKGRDFLKGGRGRDKCRGGAARDKLRSCP